MLPRAVPPADGHLYVCGLNGWQTAAQADGCLQRVRLHRQAARRADGDGGRGERHPSDVRRAARREGGRRAAQLPVGVVELPLERRLRLEDWSVADPNKVGIDPVPVTAATLGADGRSVTLKFADMRPAMQTKIEYDLKAADGSAHKGAVYTTIREWK